MTPYSRMTKDTLEKIMLQRIGGTSKWMFMYLKKDMLIRFLEQADRMEADGKKVKLSQQHLDNLKAMQKAHKTASKRRAEAHGTTTLTTREILADLVNSHQLRYAGKRVFEKPFPSPTGNRREATVASVFVNESSVEYFLTRSECKFLNEELGIEMPKEAFRSAPRSPGQAARKDGRKTLGDL